VKTANVQCDVKPFSAGGLTLPTMYLASINHITAFRMLNFVLRGKDLLTAIKFFLYTISSFVRRRSAA